MNLSSSPTKGFYVVRATQSLSRTDKHNFANTMFKKIISISLIYSVLSETQIPFNFVPTEIINGNNNSVIFQKSVYDSTYRPFERIINPSSSNLKEHVVFLKNYNSLKPVAVLVDEKEKTFNDAANFIGNVFETPVSRGINFLLMTYNSSGVSGILESSKNDAQRFENLLKCDAFDSSYLGPVNRDNGTLAFFAILHASQNLPKKSGILIFIDRPIADENLAQLALQTVKEKSIRVYVVWGGINLKINRILKDLCSFSNGLFMYKTMKDTSSNNYKLLLENNQSLMNVSVLLTKKNLLGENDLTFPIDSGVTGVHITIYPSSTAATLTFPNGHAINLSANSDDVADYSTGSFNVVDAGLRKVHVNVTTLPTPGVGFWRIKLYNAQVSYNVTVYVCAKLTAYARLVKNDNRDLRENVKEIVKLGVHGDISFVSDVTFVDTNGETISNNNRIFNNKHNYLLENYNNVGEFKNISIVVDNTPKHQFYAVVKGKDTKGDAFERMAYVVNNFKSDSFTQRPILVEVASSSELITTGGKTRNIYFEITNLGDNAINVKYYCTDTKAILRSMSPQWSIISPQEKTTVRVTIIPSYGTYEDELKFSAVIGTQIVSKKVIVNIGTLTNYETEEPQLSHKYTSDCTETVFKRCDEGSWTVEITAKDTGSGLLQITSVPRGMYFPYGYTTGTRDEVTGYFSESCCNPDLTITAIDRLNNRKSYSINAYRAFWSVGAIAAVVLGIVLLLLIIALIVFFVLRSRKKQESYNLPTYRGGNI